MKRYEKRGRKKAKSCKMRIAVIYADRKKIKNITSDWQGRNTNADAESVIKALKKLKHKVVSYPANLDLYEKLKKEKSKIDLVFNVCDDGFFAQPELEPHVPAMLDVLKIPYTGAGHLCLGMSVNKGISSKLLSFHKLPTPNFQIFNTWKEKLERGMKFPIIIKPIKENGSIGIKDSSVVHNKEKLMKKVKAVIRTYKQPALVEEFIDGREFNVGVIGNEVLPVSEISFKGLPSSKPRILNYDAKWKKQSISYKFTNRICPAKISKKLERKLKNLALNAGSILNCKDYYRVDFRVRGEKPYILEINQSPDISEDAGLNAMAKAAGYSYPKLIDKIVKSALKRKC